MQTLEIREDIKASIINMSTQFLKECGLEPLRMDIYFSYNHAFTTFLNPHEFQLYFHSAETAHLSLYILSQWLENSGYKIQDKRMNLYGGPVLIIIRFT